LNYCLDQHVILMRRAEKSSCSADEEGLTKTLEILLVIDYCISCLSSNYTCMLNNNRNNDAMCETKVGLLRKRMEYFLAIHFESANYKILFVQQ
jgi:hypothetical protein